MTSSTIIHKLTPLSCWDDEMPALSLQLKEIEVQNLTGKGKYAANNPPDARMAFYAFLQEMIEHLTFRVI
jgi:hypothetical protein